MSSFVRFVQSFARSRWILGIGNRACNLTRIKEGKFTIASMHGRSPTTDFILLYQASSLRPDTESPLLSPSRCPRARARALQSIPAGKRVAERKCTYVRVAKRCERSVRDISPPRAGGGGEAGERGSRLRNPPTRSRSASPKSQGSCQGCTAECTVGVGMLEIR